MTAFTVESYKWLNEEPTDATVRLLVQLSQHLGTPNVSAVDPPSFVVTAEAVRINIFWFLSLVIALSAALVGILCKQWIREYQRDTPISNQEAFELRQLRFQSWEYWHVPDIISSTSLLLQLALLLFFSGVIDLLWSRVHVKMIAAIITVAIGLLVLFILVTILLPCSYDLFRVVLCDINDVGWTNLVPCAYRSPLSRVLLSLSRSMTYRRWARITGFLRLSRPTDDKFRFASNWSSVDLHLLRHYKRMVEYDITSFSHSSSRDYLHQGMKWAVSTLGDNLEMMKHLFQCMESSPSVVDTLIPYALDVTPQHHDHRPRNVLSSWEHNHQPRNSAYLEILSRWGHDHSDLQLFHIEVALHSMEAGTWGPVLIVWICGVVHRMHVNDLAGLPQGQYYFRACSNYC